MQAILKILISAILIYGISELSKRSTLLGALLASLPLTSLLAMIWLYWDTQDVKRVASLSTGVLWLVLPSLVLFALLPALLLRWQFSFPVALAIACGATVAAYFVMVILLGRFGIKV
jgi:F0F1-type ATP synthase assembly protein I